MNGQAPAGAVVDRVRLARIAADGAPPLGRVGIVGLGYVGLPTAIAFAHRGHEVLGIDVSEARLDAIARRDVDLSPIDLDRLDAVGDTLRTSTRFDGVRDCDAIVICVPTPVDRHLVPDLTALRSACCSVVAAARPGQLLLLTSTSYVGTTRDLLVGPLLERELVPGEDISVAFSPERIDPANHAFDHHEVPRVVGGVTPSCTLRARALLLSLTPDVHSVSSPEAAEMCKLLENTFRAVNITLANEFADIARTMQLDPVEVIDAAATKPYGFMPFYPGPGVGGHCIPCDPRYLQWQLRARRTSTPLIDVAMASIADRPSQVVRRAVEVLSRNGVGIRQTRVLVLGVAYKRNVSDVRESPALEILDALMQLGAEVAYHDPLVPAVRLPNGAVLRSVEAVHASAYDLVITHTAHDCIPVECVLDAPIVLDATYRLPCHRRVLP